jgi:NAD(P)-dependent dehydrogenase (short-subunit alcohol dehydrogenase family)
MVRTRKDAALDRGREIDSLNNAGALAPAFSSVDYPEADCDRVFEVNLKGTFPCCKAVPPVMALSGSFSRSPRNSNSSSGTWASGGSCRPMVEW